MIQRYAVFEDRWHPTNDDWGKFVLYTGHLADKEAAIENQREEWRDNKRYLENDLALKMEQIADLKKRLVFIFDVWGRWKDFERTSYPTIEQTHQALYDFGKAIEKSMTGYNPGR